MNVEQIEILWNKYKKLVDVLDTKYSGLSQFVESNAERIIECPAAADKSYYGAYPGGLLDLSLGITSKMRSISKALDLQIDQNSVLFVGLTHALGLIGDESRSYLVPHDSEWHIKKGIMYKYNEDLPKMIVSHRSLHLLQSAGIKISMDEWVAIAISCGTHREDSRFYVGSEPPVGTLLLQARQWVIGRSE